MRLQELIEGLEDLAEGLTIYVVRPWSCASTAVVAREPESGGLPVTASAIGAEYFLEVSVAQEFLEGWRRTQSSPTTNGECQRLIQYATYDA